MATRLITLSVRSEIIGKKKQPHRHSTDTRLIVRCNVVRVANTTFTHATTAHMHIYDANVRAIEARSSREKRRDQKKSSQDEPLIR